MSNSIGDGTQNNGERLRDVPEIFDFQNNENYIVKRAESIAQIKGLGPTDLVSLTKTRSEKNSSKDIFSFHFILGVDTSSTATIAAYLNSLCYSMEENIGWFRSNPWKITKGLYCCYNCFSGVDVRVEAKIPGGVSSWAVTSNGLKIPTTQDMWKETFISAILRAIHYDRLNLTGLRRIDPLLTENIEKKFLEMSTDLFFDSWRLGSALGHQNIANNVNNFLAVGICKYFMGSQKFDTAINYFDSLRRKDPEVASLQVKCLLAADREPEAVKLTHQTLIANPNCCYLLISQCEFLLEKKSYEKALQIAKLAVKSNPIDFYPWIVLARCFLFCEQYEQVLQTLNTCPVTLQSENEIQKLPPNSRVWIPHSSDCPVDIVSGNSLGKDHVLERLRGSLLNGALKMSYSVLVQLVNSIGWDSLLQLRSKVFVMEEEYRFEKNSKGQEMEELAKAPKVSTSPELNTTKGENLETIPLSNTKLAVTSNEEKRLCERWLDGLFLILFEDIRIHTIYRAEVQNHKNENMPYQRSPREWLILADLCRRIGKMEESKEAYRRCVEGGFCWDAWLALLEIYTDEERTSNSLAAASKLLEYQSGHYCDILYPSPIGEQIYKLIRKVGTDRIKATLMSLTLPSGIEEIIMKYVEASKLIENEPFTIGH